MEINKEFYINAMAENLQMLRAKINLTQEELCYLAGVSRQTIVNVERNKKLTLNTYLSLVFVFQNNKETSDLMSFLGIYPTELLRILDKSIENERELI